MLKQTIISSFIFKVKAFVVSIFFLASLSSMSFAQDIDFKTTDWKSILAQSKKENKLIFVDVYTDWCTPCKIMDADVFPQKSVSTFYNENFINYKLDAEKNEGPSLKKKYDVKGYPTYLFIKHDGTLVYHTSNLLSVRELIAAGKVAIAEKDSKKQIAKWQKEYSTKKNDLAFMKDYLIKRSKLQMESTTEIDQYLQLIKPENRLDTTHLNVFLANSSPLSLSSKTLNFLIDNYGKIKEDTLLKKSLYRLVEGSLKSGFHQVYQSNDLKAFKIFLELNNKARKYDERYENNIRYEEVFYRVTKNFVAYKALLPRIEIMIKQPIIIGDAGHFANLLNNVASTLYKNDKDPQTLSFAKNVVEKAILLSPELFPTNFMVFNTYSKILNALGQKNDAIYYAEKALIQLGNKDDSRFNFKKQLIDDLATIKSLAN